MKLDDKASEKENTQTECLIQQERENFSSCVIFHVRPLELKTLAK